MKLKYFAFFFSLALNSYAFEPKQNLCDTLIENKAPISKIQDCLEDKSFGPSDYYVNRIAKEKKKAEAEKIKNAKADEIDSNLEVATFILDGAGDLQLSEFGMPYFAIRGDYRNNKYKEVRLTSSEDLCIHKGYEKAIKSVLSQELYGNTHKKGVTVEVSMFGNSKVAVFEDKDQKFTVKKYTELSCVRRKNKDLPGSKDAIKALGEITDTLNDELKAPSDAKSATGEKDSARSNAGKVTTPNSYKSPWDETPAPVKTK